MTARVGPRLALHRAVIAASLAGCADDTVDRVTRDEGCAGYDLGALLETRLVGGFDMDEANPEPGAAEVQELRDEAAVRDWYDALGFGYGSEFPSHWELPDFGTEMGVTIPWADGNVVPRASRTGGVVGFYDDVGPSALIVAVYQLPAECDYSEYHAQVISLHAVPVGKIETCSFGNPEFCCSYLDREEC